MAAFGVVHASVHNATPQLTTFVLPFLVSLLRELKHANIVTLHDIIHSEKSLVLVFEYLESDLKSYMERCSNLIHVNNIKVSRVLLSWCNGWLRHDRHSTRRTDSTLQRRPALDQSRAESCNKWRSNETRRHNSVKCFVLSYQRHPSQLCPLLTIIHRFSLPFFAVIFVPIIARTGLLSQTFGAASGSQAAESADQWKGRPEIGRLRTRTCQIRSDEDFL